MRAVLALFCASLLIACGSVTVRQAPQPTPPGLSAEPKPPEHAGLKIVPAERSVLEQVLRHNNVNLSPHGRRLRVDAVYVWATATLYVSMEYRPDTAYGRIELDDSTVFVHEEWDC